MNFIRVRGREEVIFGSFIVLKILGQEEFELSEAQLSGAIAVCAPVGTESLPLERSIRLEIKRCPVNSCKPMETHTALFNGRRLPAIR